MTSSTMTPSKSQHRKGMVTLQIHMSAPRQQNVAAMRTRRPRPLVAHSRRLLLSIRRARGRAQPLPLLPLRTKPPPTADLSGLDAEVILRLLEPGELPRETGDGAYASDLVQLNEV